MKLEYACASKRLAESDGGDYLATVPDLPRLHVRRRDA